MQDFKISWLEMSLFSKNDYELPIVWHKPAIWSYFILDQSFDHVLRFFESIFNYLYNLVQSCKKGVCDTQNDCFINYTINQCGSVPCIK